LRDYARTEVPWQEANRIFYLRNTGLQSQSVLYMQTNINSPPQLVLNPNTISTSGAIAVRDYAVSPDGRYLAYNTSLAAPMKPKRTFDNFQTAAI
jgi:prolyl oligopeptidase